MNNVKQPIKRSDNVPLAVGVILVTVLALSLGDAVIKLTSNNFVIWQIFVVRSVIAIPCLVLLITVMSDVSLKLPDALMWTVLRSFLLMLMWISYYVSLPVLTLSAAAAAYYTLPIFITLFSAAILGDRISRAGWMAVFMGFAGVILILQPKAKDFNWFALLPIFSAILYAFSMILTRTKCRSDHPLLLSLALNICFAVVGCLVALAVETLPIELRHGFLLATWVEMGAREWLSMSFLTIAILIGSIGAAIAYQNGPPSVIGTFDFGYIGFAVLWGILFFGEVPDVLSIAGIVLIIAAGIISLRQ